MAVYTKEIEPNFDLLEGRGISLNEIDKFIEEKISYKSNVEIHKYPEAEHAFARHGAESYSKEEADLALERSVSFLDIHLK